MSDFDLKTWALSPSRFAGDYEKRKAVRELLAENERLEADRDEWRREFKESDEREDRYYTEKVNAEAERDAAVAVGAQLRAKVKQIHTEMQDGVVDWDSLDGEERQGTLGEIDHQLEKALSAGPEIMAVVDGYVFDDFVENKWNDTWSGDLRVWKSLSEGTYTPVRCIIVEREECLTKKGDKS